MAIDTHREDGCLPRHVRRHVRAVVIRATSAFLYCFQDELGPVAWLGRSNGVVLGRPGLDGRFATQGEKRTPSTCTDTISKACEYASRAQSGRGGRAPAAG